MQTEIAPMSLGDIFDRLFKLVGKTALRSLIIAVIVLLPASLVVIYGMDLFFSGVAQFSRAAQENQEMAAEGVLSMLGSLFIYMASLTLFTLATLAATMAVTIVGCGEMSEEPRGWRGALAQTFGVRLFRLYGQVFLEYLAVGSLFFFPNILLGVGLT